jgi:hypothetical protein
MSSTKALLEKPLQRNSRDENDAIKNGGIPKEWESLRTRRGIAGTKTMSRQCV